MVWGPSADGSEGSRHSGHLTPTRAAAADRVGAVGVDGTDPEDVELGAEEGVRGIDDGSLRRMRPDMFEDHCTQHHGIHEVAEGEGRCTSEGPTDLERNRNAHDPNFRLSLIFYN